jgi:hypothetical protein
MAETVRKAEPAFRWLSATNSKLMIAGSVKALYEKPT